MQMVSGSINDLAGDSVKTFVTKNLKEKIYLYSGQAIPKGNEDADASAPTAMMHKEKMQAKKKIKVCIRLRTGGGNKQNGAKQNTWTTQLCSLIS